MRLRLLPVVVAALAGCTPPPVPLPPPAPDASDAAPPPLPILGDAYPPQTPCQAACSALDALGCIEGGVSDCATVLAGVDGRRLIRTPSGAPLTCAALAAARSVAEVRALGVACTTLTGR